MTEYLKISMGDSFHELFLHGGRKAAVDRQPAGLNFHSFRWDKSKLGEVRFGHGKFSLEIPDCLSVSVPEDTDLSSLGVGGFDVNVSLSATSFIPHAEALKRIFGFLRTIEQKGWMSVQDRGGPRLHGADRFNYTLENIYLNGLGVDYVPELSRWMSIEDGTPWVFYADVVFLMVSFQRDARYMDPSKLGVYLLSFDFESAEEHFKAYMRPENWGRWRELLPAELERAAKERARKEAELKALGVTIDETYVDPPVPAMK